jgi:glycosyltransferase involved in cell wall biosynthesis
MGNTRLKVLRIGPKNYPPHHGGVEKNAYWLVVKMPEVENHIFTEWEPETNSPRVKVLPKGLFSQLRMAHTYSKRKSIDIIHLHKEGFIPLAVLLKLAGHRCVLTIHGCAWRLKRWPFQTRILLFLLDCVACCLLDRTVFVGERDWQLFRKVLFFRKLYLIRNGVVVRRKLMSLKQDGLVYLGRISPEKNILSLIKAAETAKVNLDLYGPFDHRDGEFRETVLRMVRESRYVEWKGPVPFEAVAETLLKYRAFINVSFSEGLPTSVLEAAAEGLYLVLSDIPQHRLLRMPDCTYVNPHELDLSRILLPVGKDAGIANHVHVQREFSLDRVIKAYSKIYRDLS